VWTIDDLGHVLANALKAQFDNTRAFQRFVAIIHRGAARLRQTSLAFLMPPKLRAQGRFKGSLAWINGLKRYSRPWREAGVLKTTA
jgi:hypothetical protein